LRGVGITPIQSVAGSAGAGIAGLPGSIDPALLLELWSECDAPGCGVTQAEFNEILALAGAVHNFGLATGAVVSRQQQAAYLRSLKLGDLVLARACASGNERAWERFMVLYRQPLTRAAIAITGSETLGSDLADQLYAELYGLSTRDGARRCPLDSYRGRGSLMGWLRTIVAQRYVDHHRRSHREEPLEELDAPAREPEPEELPADLAVLKQAVAEALCGREAEERFLLATYYLDGRTLQQIARVLHVHEATVSRKLHRATESIRKQIVKNLQRVGLSRRGAEEALGADPRDLDMNLKKLLQKSLPDAFQESDAR